MSFARSDLVLEGSSYDIWIYGYDKYSMASKICPFPIWDVLMVLPTNNKVSDKLNSIIHSTDYSEVFEVAEFSIVSTKNSSHPFPTNSGNLVPLTSLPSH